MTALLADALRAVAARPLAAAVAWGGLALAGMALLLAVLLLDALTATDPTVPEPERVVILDFKGHPPGQDSDWFGASPVFFGPALKARALPLVAVARSHTAGLTVQLPQGPRQVALVIADAELPALLGLRALHGDLAATMARPDGIAITPALVRRLWGDLPPEQALGRRLSAGQRDVQVGAILPPASGLNPYDRHDALVGYDSLLHGRSAAEREAVFVVNGRVFVRLQPGVTPQQVAGWMKEAFLAAPGYAQLPAAWREGRDAASFRAVPLTERPWLNPGMRQHVDAVLALCAACALLLAMAAVNALNLQQAALLQRQRETALRRALGADSPRLRRLWAAECGLPMLAATALALLLVWAVGPLLSDALELPMALPLGERWPPAVLAGTAAAVAALWAMLVALPARAALRRAPAAALQGRTASEGPGGRRWRQALLALQLGCVLLLVGLGTLLALQQDHLLGLPRGFETRDRLVVTMFVSGGDGSGTQASGEHLRMGALAERLRGLPGVRALGYSDIEPAGGWGGTQETYTTADRRQAAVRAARVSPGFFATYGLKLLAGRVDGGGLEGQVVLDARAARDLGYADPAQAVGQRVGTGGEWMQAGSEARTVAAVVADVKLEDGREPAKAHAFVLQEAPQFNLTLHADDTGALREAVLKAWRELGIPHVPLLMTADEQVASNYRREAEIGALLAVVAVLAALMAGAGAYALVADGLRRRRTELVLRRLHGAGDAALVASTLRELALPLGVAVAVAAPLVVAAGLALLGGYVDHIDPAAGLLGAVGAALLLVLLMLGLAAAQHLRAALALRPVEALR